MALEEITGPIQSDRSEIVEETSFSPKVNICVTADIHVIQCSTSASDEICGPQVGIFTTLSAVFKGPLTSSDKKVVSIKDSEESQSLPFLVPSPIARTQDQRVLHKSEELISRSVVSQYQEEVIEKSIQHESKEVVNQLVVHESQEIVDQPVVHRSQKRTQLNSFAKVKQYGIGNKAQIKRTVLLPYFGCTTEKQFINRSKKKEVMIKSSKSWVTIKESSKYNEQSRVFISKSLHNLPLANKLPENKRLERYKPLIYSSKQQASLKSASSSLNDSVKNFYFIQDLNSGSQVLFIDEGNIKYLCTPIIDPEINKGSVLLKPNKIELNRNISESEQEIIPACTNIHPKATRNVSILHRPKTRNKATSTSSLNNYIMERSIDDSIKGLLMPYISAGKDFPSELVLKLVPKNDVENKPIDSNQGSAESSETDLLAPILNTPPKQKKKKKRSFFAKFFKCKKNGDDGSDSSESLTKEIYYPSVVEVYDKKSRKSPNEIDSEKELTPSNHNREEIKKESS